MVLPTVLPLPNVSISYVGRFAPSPTGALHFGSLVTALASYCDAKAHAGQWLVRIEDTDIPRNVNSAIPQILQTLEDFALQWDGEILFQSKRLEFYQHIIQQLAVKQQVYGCACSRKQLANSAHYGGFCAHLQLPLDGNATRLRVPDQIITYQDAVQGNQHENLTHTTGDFVLRRRDGIISYQLAVVVDDAAQQVTHVVRGADLLDNTARQLWLQHCLGYRAPCYAHIPLAINAQGQKLSKQNLATPLDVSQAPILIDAALCFLGQPKVARDTPYQMLKQAVAQWQLQSIPKSMSIMFSANH